MSQITSADFECVVLQVFPVSQTQSMEAEAVIQSPNTLDTYLVGVPSGIQEGDVLGVHVELKQRPIA